IQTTAESFPPAVYALEGHTRGLPFAHAINALRNSVALFALHRRSHRFPAKHLKTQLFHHPARGASCVGLLRPQMSEGEFGDGKSQPDWEPGWHRHRTGSQAQPGNCTAPAAQAALTCSPNSKPPAENSKPNIARPQQTRENFPMCNRYVTPDQAAVERYWHVGRQNPPRLWGPQVH